MKFKALAAAACILFAAASAGSAATFNIEGSFSGGQLGDVAFDVTIDADFSADIASTSSGLTIRSLTSSEVGGDPFPVAGGLGYLFLFDFDFLVIGGLSGGASSVVQNRDDFTFGIVGFSSSAPNIFPVQDSSSQLSGFAVSSPPSVTITEVSAVPLPAGFLLLLSGLGGLAALKRRKKRAA